MPLTAQEQAEIKDRLDNLEALATNFERYRRRPDQDSGTRSQLDWARTRVLDAAAQVRELLSPADRSRSTSVTR